jgi:hypothetical protein
MRIIIQCAGDKPDEGYFRGNDGRIVNFVAHPELASPAAQTEHVLARPDDIATGSRTWRELVVEYNALAVTRGNGWGILQASRLYRPPIYNQLVTKFGAGSLFILSAGWGLIRSDFLTPNYDITFSSKAERMNQRRHDDRFQDLVQLDANSAEPIVFLGGKEYIPLFCLLTACSRAERLIYFNSSTPPVAPGCRLERYHTTRRTNWHYECANRLVAGTLIPVPPSPPSPRKA